MSEPRVRRERITHCTPEPPRGSIVIRDGLSGTAYQRLHSDGRWHPTTGSVVVDWEYFTRRASPSLAGDYLLLVGEPREHEDAFEDAVQHAMKTDHLAFGHLLTGAPKLARERAERLVRGEVEA